MRVAAENINSTTKTQMEQVEKKKHEYKLIGKYLRTRGLKLYAYNSLKDELKEIVITKKETVNIIPDENGKLVPVNLSLEETQVDSRHEHFEALNFRTAERRVLRYKSGIIKELCNLRKPSIDGIKFY